MLPPKKILVIDHNADSGSLLVRTLARKFPQTVVQLCPETEPAVAAAATEAIDTIVLHRTFEDDAVSLVRAIRAVNKGVPILGVSGIDRSEKLLAAGADGFLNYDEWLRVGIVVNNLLEKKAVETKP